MEQSFTLLNRSSPLIPFNITCFATRFDKFSKIHLNKAFYFTAIPVNTKHLHSPTSLTLYKCYTNVLCVLGCRLFQKVSILSSLSFKISSSLVFALLTGLSRVTYYSLDEKRIRVCCFVKNVVSVVCLVMMTIN